MYKGEGGGVQETVNDCNPFLLEPERSSSKENLIPKSKTYTYENLPQCCVLSLQGTLSYNSSLVFYGSILVLSL